MTTTTLSAIEIPDTYKACKTDSDCTTVATKCTGDCGTSINKYYAIEIKKTREAACKDFKGPFKMIKCGPTVNRCINNMCTRYNDEHLEILKKLESQNIKDQKHNKSLNLTGAKNAPPR